MNVTKKETPLGREAPSLAVTQSVRPRSARPRFASPRPPSKSQPESEVGNRGLSNTQRFRENPGKIACFIRRGVQAAGPPSIIRSEAKSLITSPPRRTRPDLDLLVGEAEGGARLSGLDFRLSGLVSCWFLSKESGDSSNAGLLSDDRQNPCFNKGSISKMRQKAGKTPGNRNSRDVKTSTFFDSIVV